MNYLSKCLEAEYSSQGILIQTVTPGQVNTSLAKQLYDPSMAVPANEFVQHALKAVGTESMTNAHPKHKLINNIFTILDQLLPERLFMNIKLRAMTRMAQQKKAEREKQD